MAKSLFETFFGSKNSKKDRDAQTKARSLRLENLEDRQLLTAVGWEAPATAAAYSSATLDDETISLSALNENAQTIVVTNADASGEGSLTQAIADAKAGDTITFDESLNGQTIASNTGFTVSKGITIDASDLEDGVTLSANGKLSSVLKLSNGTADNPIVLKNLTLTGSKSISNGGGIYAKNAIVDVYDCVVTGNTAKFGAGLYVAGTSSFTATNLTVSGNTATGSGGAVYATGGTLNLNGATFSGNKAAYGGAVYADSETIVANDLLVSANATTNAANGAIYVYNGSFDATNAVVAKNTGAPAILIGQAGALVATNSTVADNAAGGIKANAAGAKADVYNSIVVANEAGDIAVAAGSVAGSNNLSGYTAEGFNVAEYDAQKALFADAENGDYSLVPYSQGVDVGNNEYVKVETDAAGGVRVVNAVVDLGAYERQTISLTEVAIDGANLVGGTLTAVVAPEGATADYQWYVVDESEAGKTAIEGATAATYVPTADDFGKQLVVVATGNDKYSETVESTATDAIQAQFVAPAFADGTTTTDAAITLSWSDGAVFETAPASYSLEYKVAADEAAEWTVVSVVGTEATVDGLAPLTEYAFRVKAVAGQDQALFVDSEYSETTNATTERRALTSVSISGSFLVGETLTATVAPEGATASYQWFVLDDSEAGKTAIEGATAATFAPSDAYLGKTLNVEATGIEAYSETVSSDAETTVKTPFATPTIAYKSRACDEITVSWSDASVYETAPASYVVEYAVAGTQNWASKTVAGTETSATIGGLASKTNYVFRVKAIAANGDAKFVDSAYSNEVSAQTFLFVSNTNSDASTGSIRWAIAQAAEGETIAFARSMNGRTISGSRLDVTKAVVIDALDLSNGVTLSGNNSSTVLYVKGGSANSPITFKGLTIANGWNDKNAGGVYAEDGVQTFVSCRIVGNYGYYGGGVFCTGGTQNFVGCGIYSNKSDNAGVYAQYGDQTYVNCVVADNQGSGIYNQNGSTTATNCTIVVNASAGVNLLYGSATIRNSILLGNRSATSGSVTLQTCMTSGDLATVFNNPSAGDFSLAYASPAQNAGNNSYIAGYDYDIIGNPRIDYQQVDLGAYERQTTRMIAVTIDAPDGYIVGETLTAVTDPAAATVDYQWYSVAADGTQTAIQGATAATYTIEGAVRGNRISVTAVGYNDYAGTVSSGPSDDTAKAIFTTPVVTATPTDCETISVSWTDSSVFGDNPTDYALEYKAADAEEWTVVSVPGNQTTYSVSGLTEASSYLFRVKARANAEGDAAHIDSDYSEEVGAETPTAPLLVWKTGDEADSYGTLRWAIARAQEGDTIPFAESLAGQTITVGTELTIEKSLTIDASAAAGVVVDGANATRLFNISTGTVALKGLTLQNGAAEDGGAIYLTGEGTSLTVENSVLTGNVAQFGGGAIYADATGSLTIVGSTVSGNKSINDESGEGGAVFAANLSSFTVNRSIFQNNQARRLAASAIYSVADLDDETAVGGDVVLANSLFTDNGSDEVKNVDAVAIVNAANVVVVNNVFANNKLIDETEETEEGETRVKGHSLSLGNDSEETGTTALVANNVLKISDVALESDLIELDVLASKYNNVAPEDANLDAEYKPTFDSFAIVGKGDNQYVYGDFDLAGNARVFGSTVDVGAYELQQAIPLTGVSIVADETEGYFVGKTLTAVLAKDAEQATFQWFVADESEAGKTAIEGATAATFELTTDYIGKTLIVEATGVDPFGETVSATAAEVVQYNLETPTLADPTATETTISVAWDAVDFAKGYSLEYKTSAAEEWTVVAIQAGEGVETAYTIEGLTANAEYSLRVKATGDGVAIYDSAYSEAKTITTVAYVLPAVSLSTDSPVVTATVAASFEAEGVTATYQWYRVDAEGAATEIADATAAAYVATVDDIGFALKVVATGTGEYAGTSEATTANATITNVLATPANFVSTGKTETTISVAWDAVENASGYSLEYKTGEGDWTVVKVAATETTYTIEGLTANAEYSLRVKATGDSNPFVDSEYAETSETTDAYVLPVVSLSTDSPVVTAEIAASFEAEGVTATYQWYRVDAEGAATEIADATAATYVATVDDIGFALKVVATGTGEYAGTSEATTANATITNVLAAPTLEAAGYSATTVSVAWDAVENASGYSLEYKASGAEEWTVVSVAATETSYTVEGLETAVAYVLRVKAVGDSNPFVDSAYSNEVVVSTATKTLPTKLATSTSQPTVNVEITTSFKDAKSKIVEGVTATYQWYRVDATTGEATAIEGATQSSYTPVLEDVGYKLRVTATGYGDYAGTKTTTHGKVTIAKYASKPIVSVSDKDANSITVVWETAKNAAGYSFEYKATGAETWTVVELAADATSHTADGLAANASYDFQVKSLGDQNPWVDSEYAELNESTDAYVLPAVVLSTDAPVVTVDVAASFDVEGANVTATYQWYRVQGEETIEIVGATDATYTATVDDIGYALKVVATGYGEYEGTSEATTLNATVTNVLATPVLEATAQTETTISVAWETIADASGYALEYKTGDADWAVVELAATETAYTVEGLVANATYSFRLKAVGDANPFVDSEYSDEIEATTDAYVLPTVVLSTDSPVVAATVETSFDVEGATVTATYQWYRVQGEETIEIVGATDATYAATVDDIGFALKVVATGTGEYAGTSEATTANATITNVLATPANFASTGKTATTISVAWDVVENASGYALEYKASGAEEWTVVSVVATETTYTVEGLAGNETYRLRVKATGDSNPFVDSEYSATVEETTATKELPAKLATSTSQPTVNVKITTSFKDASGKVVKDVAATYQWYRVDAKTGEATAIEGATASSYTPVLDDLGYKIRVTATGYGEYAGEKTVTHGKATIAKYLAKPVLKVAATTTDTITVSWAKVAKTAGYSFEYKATGAEEWTVVELAATATSYKVEGLNVNASYDFQVKAIGALNPYFDSEYATLTASTKAYAMPYKLATSSSQPTVNVKITTSFKDAKSKPVSGVTATYQWYRVDATTGEATAIEGATESSYTPVLEDVGYKLRVTATGYGEYAGTKSATHGKATIAKYVATPVLEVSDKTTETITVAWDAVANVSGYSFEYKATDAEEWIVAAESTTETSLTVEGLNVNASYDFRVKAFGNQKPWVDSKDYGTLTASTDAYETPAVLLPSGAPVVGTEIAAYFEDVEIADFTGTYQWSRVDDDDVATPIEGATDYAYTPTSDDFGYRLRIDATGYGEYAGTTFAVTDDATIGTKLETPTLQDDETTETTISVSWNDVENAVGYTLRYKASDAEEWTVAAASTTETSFTVEGLTANAEYDFQVKADGDQNPFYDSEYSETLTVKTVAYEAPRVHLTTGAPKVGSEIAVRYFGATGEVTATYQWCRVDTTTGEATAIEDATEAAYTPTEADAGYYLRVVAVGTGEFVGVSYATTVQFVDVQRVDAPVLDAIDRTATSVAFVWTEVENASGYQFEYKASDAEDWTTIDVAGTFYAVDDLTAETTYSFRVKAISADETLADSEYSATLELTTDFAVDEDDFASFLGEDSELEEALRNFLG